MTKKNCKDSPNEEKDESTKKPRGIDQQTPKKASLVKWVEKIDQIITETNQKRGSFNAKMAPIPCQNPISRRRRDKKTKWYRFSTQKIRREITCKLGILYDIALDFAKDETLGLKEREKWGRLTTYIAQTINSISRSYDDVVIEKQLNKIEKYVDEHINGNPPNNFFK